MQVHCNLNNLFITHAIDNDFKTESVKKMLCLPPRDESTWRDMIFARFTVLLKHWRMAAALGDWPLH